MSDIFSTRLAHSGDGQEEKVLREYKSVPEVQPVYMTSVFAFDDIESVDDIYEGKADGYIYSRIKHPNSDAVAKVLADIEGAEDGAVFSSGMAAIVTSIISVVKAGDHIVSAPVLYGGVRDYLENEIKRFGVEVTFTDFSDPENIKKAIRPNTKLVYTETISNPLIEVPDIEAAAKIAHENGALFFIDNTFASPIVANPVKFGADVVLYSATKYLGGHSDLVGGAAVGKKDVLALIKKKLILYGATLGPAESWLLARSLRTLDLRVTKQSENALKVAKYLETDPAVTKVYYAGLESSPYHKLADKFFNNGLYGGMLSVDIKGGVEEVENVVKKLGFIKNVPSLAGTSTSVSYPAKTSHRAYSKEELDKAGITLGLLRFSIGIESADDIIAAIKEALKDIR
ncbi:MAG: aminotransferase class I/II-fold pyridoxal phosphate-dependent enzyme [Lachnospiraceae bacterium]|nr:aminotransferase class I/II-fold pyridoxal phosphate-dependent enzyme [Lachnospiraceae bacterium]